MLNKKNSMVNKQLLTIIIMFFMIIISFALINSTYAYDIQDGENLKDGIDNALGSNNTGTLELKEEETYEAENIIIKSNTNVTIKGKGSGSTIDGLSYSRLFYLEQGSSLYLYNIHLIDGKLSSGNGSFIYNNGGYLYLENCTFYNGSLSTSSGYGGIYATSGTTTIVEKCIFEKNTGYVGSSIYNLGNLTIKNSVIKNNTVRYGSIAGGGKINIYDSEFNGNTYTSTTASGIDIYLSGTSNAVINNVIFNNTVTISGSIYTTATVGNVSISHSKFINIDSRSGGAAIEIIGGDINITDSLFDSNIPKSTGSQTYGVISIRTNSATNSLIININNCNFTNNEVYWAGAIYGGSTYNTKPFIVNINNCFFDGNSATYSSGAGAIYTSSYDTFYISNSTFKNNKSPLTGAINIRGATEIIYCNFINNTATGSNRGGAIYYDSGVAIINYCIFINNSNSTDINHVQTRSDSHDLNIDYNWWGANGLDILDIDALMYNKALVNYYIKDISFEILSKEVLYIDDYLKLKYNFVIVDENGNIQTNNLNDFIAYIKIGSQYIEINNIGGEIDVKIDEVNGLYSLVFGCYELETLEYTALAKTGNIIIENVEGIIGDNINITASFKDQNNNPIVDKLIKFYLNGNLIGNATTNQYGVATINYILSEIGIFSLTAKYDGEDYIATEATSVLTSLENKPSIDYGEIDNIIKNASNLDKSKYTPSSWAAYENALNQLKAMIVNKNASSQSEIDNLINELNNAKAKLVTVDYTGLANIINTLSKLDKSKYTSQSWAVLQNTLNQAKTMYNAKNASFQSEINVLINTLNKNKNNLVKDTDLKITKVKRLGNKYIVTIKNTGKYKSEKTKLKISCNCGKFVKIVNVKSIGAGKSITITFKYFKYSQTKIHDKIFQVNYNKQISEKNYANNLYIIKTTKKVDLKITNVKRLGNSYKITIKNFGKDKSTKSKLKISTTSGNFVKIVNVKALGPKKSVTIVVKYFIYSKTKKYDKIFQVNFNKKAHEKNYNNNIYRIAKI